MRKFTGGLPSWVASDEQKQSLEKMIGQVQEEDMPDDNELKKLHEEGGSMMADESWMKSVTDMMPIMAGGDKSSQSAEEKESGTKKENDRNPGHENESSAPDSTSKSDTNSEGRKKPRKLASKPSNKDDTEQPNNGIQQGDKQESLSDDKGGEPAKSVGAEEEWVARDEEEKELLKQHRAKKREQQQREAEKKSEERSRSKGRPRKLETRS